MSYTKQTWNTGDTITAERLNHMEDGIGGGISVITITLTDTPSSGYEASTDTSYDDALSAMRNGVVIFKLVNDEVTQHVFGMVDYDPEAPNRSDIAIIDNVNLNVRISWNSLGISVSPISSGSVGE